MTLTKSCELARRDLLDPMRMVAKARASTPMHMNALIRRDHDTPYDEISARVMYENAMPLRRPNLSYFAALKV